MKYVFLLLSTAMLLGSCTTMHIEKRKFRKGWYIEKHSNSIHPSSIKHSDSLAVWATTESELIEPICKEQTVEAGTLAELTINQNDVYTEEEILVRNEEKVEPLNTKTVLPIQASHYSVTTNQPQPCDTIITKDNNNPDKKRGLVYQISQTKPHYRLFIGLGLLIFFAALTVFAYPILILIAPLLVFLPLAFIISGIIDMIRKKRETLTPSQSYKTFSTLLVSSLWTGLIASLVWIALLITLIIMQILGPGN